MRRVFNYIEYLNESMKKDAKDALINSFFTALAEALADNDFGESYHLLCLRDEDLEARHKQTLEKLHEAGWTNEALENLFMDHGDEIAQIYNDDTSNIVSRVSSDNNTASSILPCGDADYTLYKLTNGEVWLAGYRVSQIDSGEKFFKFAYGYATKHKYGKLQLVQDYGSMSKYIDTIGTEFPELFGPDDNTAIYAPSESEFGQAAVKKSYSYKDGVGKWDLNKLIAELRPENGIDEIMPDIEKILDELNLSDSYKIDDNVIYMYWNKKIKDVA